MQKMAGHGAAGATGGSCPFLEFQKELIRPLLNQNLVKGSTWYLIDVRWMKQWKQYTGYETCDQSHSGQSSYFPGHLVTDTLFADVGGGVLKEHLVEELDYTLVPEEAWGHLVKWYGLADGSRPIPRRVVEYGLYMKHCKVEVYLLHFKLTLHPKLSESTIEPFSRANTVGNLEAVMRRLYSVPDQTTCRVWHRYMSHTYGLLSDPFQTLQDAGLYNTQTIVLEVQNSDGTWPMSTQGIGHGSITKQVQMNSPSKPDTGGKQGSTAIRAQRVAKAKPTTMAITEPGEHVQVKEASVPPEEVAEDDWLLKQQKSQHDELVQSVATEHKRANQASQRAKDALDRLAQKEGQVKSLNKALEENSLQIEELEKSLGSQQEKREEEEKRAEKAEQRVAQMATQIQQLTQSFQTAEKERDTVHEQKKEAEKRIETLETELGNVQEQLQSTTQQLTQQLQSTSHQLQASRQQLQTTTQQLQASRQQLQETEHHLQQANERVDQQLERAAIAETRLQHSDQVFQDIFQRLIGQLPQSQPQWVVQRNEIELTEEELGAGGWATVKVATFRGNRVAAKCLHRQIVSAHNVRIFTREMKMAANARHPNLLQFIGATLDDQEPIILTELMPTSLCRVMEEGTRLSHPQIISISRQVALALNYLHLTQPKAIIHRDVSSSNVLLEPINPGFKAKLSDYGSANFVRHTTTAGPGNPTYAAPEAGNPQQQSTKMDVFSFGVLLVEMCAGELAPQEVRDRLITAIQWPPIVALIRNCLRHEPQRRPDMATVITQL